MNIPAISPESAPHFWIKSYPSPEQKMVQEMFQVPKTHNEELHPQNGRNHNMNKFGDENLKSIMVSGSICIKHFSNVPSEPELTNHTCELIGWKTNLSFRSPGPASFQWRELLLKMPQEFRKWLVTGYSLLI